MPPNLFFLLGMIGVVLARRRGSFGLAIATAAISALYLVSMPITASFLIRAAVAMADPLLEMPSGAPPGAIVVLAADALRSDIPGEPDTVGPLTLEGLAEAARQQRRLGLPILVSGRSADPPGDLLAARMSEVLQQDFGVPVRWREDRSRNTFENAAFLSAIVREAGIYAALVVAHPWDMARALWSFRAAGFPVRPAPTHGRSNPSFTPTAFLPQIPALQDSSDALHELIALAWYRARHVRWWSDGKKWKCEPPHTAFGSPASCIGRTWPVPGACDVGGRYAENRSVGAERDEGRA